MRYTYVDVDVESKSEKRIRRFLFVMYFIQTLLTTVDFMTNPETGARITPIKMLIRTDGYATGGDIWMAVAGGILVVFPMVSFFFCLLDKKSKKKYLVSALCCIVCVILILFIGNPQYLAIGAVLTLVINLVNMFMTTQGFQATRIREAQKK